MCDSMDDAGDMDSLALKRLIYGLRLRLTKELAHEMVELQHRIAARFSGGGASPDQLEKRPKFARYKESEFAPILQRVTDFFEKRGLRKGFKFSREALLNSVASWELENHGWLLL